MHFKNMWRKWEASLVNEALMAFLLFYTCTIYKINNYRLSSCMSDDVLAHCTLGSVILPYFLQTMWQTRRGLKSLHILSFSTTFQVNRRVRTVSKYSRLLWQWQLATWHQAHQWAPTSWAQYRVLRTRRGRPAKGFVASPALVQTAGMVKEGMKTIEIQRIMHTIIRIGVKHEDIRFVLAIDAGRES